MSTNLTRDERHQSVRCRKNLAQQLRSRSGSEAARRSGGGPVPRLSRGFAAVGLRPGARLAIHRLRP